MKRVAVILTGEPRQIEFCWYWWQELVKYCDHEIEFFSSTWHPMPVISNLKHVITSTPEEVLAHETKCSKELYRYFHPIGTPKKPQHGFDYYFGRLYHLCKLFGSETVKYIKGLQPYTQYQTTDVVIHARWDCAIRNTNFLNDFIKYTSDNHTYTFAGLEEKDGLVYTNDWIYAGPTEFFVRDYGPIGFDKHIRLYDTFIKENEVKAKNYLIGHNFYSTFLKQNGAKISEFHCDTTLVRKNTLEIAFNDDTWSKLLAIFLADLEKRKG
jgi:hypothetical protein